MTTTIREHRGGKNPADSFILAYVREYGNFFSIVFNHLFKIQNCVPDRVRLLLFQQLWLFQRLLVFLELLS